MSEFSKNYFELFGVPAGFLLDARELAQRYRALQKVVHPDRFAAHGAQSQRLSLQRATLVNEAYETLKDPLKRAQYLLALQGVEGDTERETLNDPQFLMQQMELREALAEVPGASDPRHRIGTLIDRIDALIKDQVTDLAMHFEQASEASLAAAAQGVQRMQFLHKLRAEAGAVEADLEEVD